MLTQEDLELIQRMIANATAGPDRTGSAGLSRASLRDALRKNDRRNQRRLDTHYVVLDVVFAQDDLIALNPNLPISTIGTYNPLPSPLGLSEGTEFITCEQGTIECLAIMISAGQAPMPEIFTEIYVNGVSVANTTISLLPGVPLLIPFNENYSAGDRISVALTNLGIEVAEVFLEATLLRKERFTSN